MNTHAEFFALLLQENYEHARLHEEHRASCANFIMALAAGLLAIGSQILTSPLMATIFGALTLAIGAYGVLLVLKHFERYTYHLKVASELRDTIETAMRDSAQPLPAYAQVLAAAEKLHFEADVFRTRGSSKPLSSHPNAWLKRLRLNKLYIAINLLVAASGVAFIVFAWTA